MLDNPAVTPAVVTYQAPCGDHNDLAMTAAGTLGRALAERLAVPAQAVGVPAAVPEGAWEEALAAAGPDLAALADRYQSVFAAGHRPYGALSRCAAALATLPVVTARHPDAVVVWMDAHGDIHTPDTTGTGYLGGMALSGPLGWWDSGHGAGIGHGRAVLVGARDLDPAETAAVEGGRIACLPPGPGLAGELGEWLDGRPVYLHLDCDVLEPGIVPTDYRVPGGLKLDDLHAVCLAVAAASPLVGAEFAEYEGFDRATGRHVPPGELLDALSPLWAGM
ncbi:arginase family protein [Nonomuraea muscovyensis]